MQTGDGLLARLRISGGRLSPSVLARLAQVAGDFGNGVVEITARGNLQVRGLTAAGALPFARAVEALVSIERGLVVETPPLAGDADELADPRPLAAVISKLALPFDPQLGPKVSVVVDGNGQHNLSSLKSDLRLVAVSPQHWALTVGGHFFGVTEEPAAAALAVVKLLAAQGAEARATDLPHMALLASIGHLCVDAPEPEQEDIAPIGTIKLHAQTAIGLGLPYGAIAWDRLMLLAIMAPRHGVSEFQLSPYHALLAIGARASLLNELDDDFIADPLDPRRRVSACIGSDGCASGHVPARVVADRLAPLLHRADTLHVSGCAKGCALPRRAAITLVGRQDGYGLVLDGKASEAPLTVLRADQLPSVVGPAWQG